MKLVIMSDSHLHNEIIKNIIEQHPDADYYIHCGDVGTTLPPELKDKLTVVKGNNDYEDFKPTVTLEFEGKKIFICHGHQFNIEESTQLLEQYAKNNDYQIVCFGHSHEPYYKIVDNITYINPGSVKFPHGKVIFTPTYCIFENNQCDFYNAKTCTKLDNIFKPKQKTSLFKRLFTKDR